MSLVDELRSLIELHDANALTAEEYTRATRLLLQDDLSGVTPEGVESVPAVPDAVAAGQESAAHRTLLDARISKAQVFQKTIPDQQSGTARSLSRGML